MFNTREADSLTIDNASVDTVDNNNVDQAASHFVVDRSDVNCELANCADLNDDINVDIANVNNNKFEMAETSERLSDMDVELVELPKAAVITRAGLKRQATRKPGIKLPDFSEMDLTAGKFMELQKGDPGLFRFFQAVNETDLDGRGKTYVIKKGLLYRKVEVGDEIRHQLIVPQILREKVMSLAHESCLGGHLGKAKTINKIELAFWWSGLYTDVKRFVVSCHACQVCMPSGYIKKVPGLFSVLSEVPFSHCYIDLIGPIEASSRSNRFILTLIDNATRFPCAKAMRNIRTETVIEVLEEFFSYIGYPDRISSDNGSNLISDLMEEYLRTKGIKHTRCSNYHPQSNVVENYNKTLKQMLKKLTIDQPKNWDQYINPCLFAYREVPHASSLFSPFELTCARSVKGPMSILRDLWTKEEIEPETRTQYQYILDMMERSEKICEMAKQNLHNAQIRNKKYYDKNAKERKLEVGDLVLVLVPLSTNKMELRWKGPLPVVEVKGNNAYRVKLEGGLVKTYHINMLKKYISRDVKNAPIVAVIAGSLEEELNEQELSIPDSEMIVHYNVHQKETYKDVDINPNLSEKQKKQILRLLEEFSDRFSDVPQVTTLGEHSIKLKVEDPIQKKPYPIPIHMEPLVDKEIETMLEMGIIGPSDSYYSSPLVILKKADGTPRICIDFRDLNRQSILDPEKSYSAEDIFNKLGGSKVYSKFDLAKGYYQVKMDEASQDYTSFSTSKGKFKFLVMPFGLNSAPMSFNRIMRKLLNGSKTSHNYLDDVITHDSSWDDHVQSLRELFERLRWANLAVKPSKCQIGYENIDFLGQTILGDSVTPRKDHLDKIFNSTRPETKTQIQSFLGLAGYYQSYVANYSSIAAPLTDCLKKKEPAKVKWTQRQEEAFQTLKNYLIKSPILKLPILDREFVLRVDASQLGVGAVLLQYHEGEAFPVSYASKKFSERELLYPISQKEGLAIVYGVQRFHKYLYGAPFTIETDHKPLEILGVGASSAPRLMRYALALQPYTFKLKYIKGEQNIGADFMSRHFLRSECRESISDKLNPIVCLLWGGICKVPRYFGLAPVQTLEKSHP